MTVLDWIAVGVVLLGALGGASQGFVWSAFSLAGLVTGAVIGGHLAPLLLSGGSSSPYAPVIAVIGAVTLAIAFEVVGSAVGAAVRGRQKRRFLRDLDSAAGVVSGALVGLTAVWVLGAMALQLPGQAQLRQAVQRSELLQRLNAIVPPRTLLNALGRIDPFQSLAGPPLPTQPLDPRVLARPGVRAAAPSVVRVLGTACGLGVEGSGWVAGPATVVTAAHVVAGETDTTVTTSRFCASSGSTPGRCGSRGRAWARASRSSATRRTVPSTPCPAGSGRPARSSARTRTGTGRSRARSLASAVP